MSELQSVRRRANSKEEASALLPSATFTSTKPDGNRSDRGESENDDDSDDDDNNNNDNVARVTAQSPLAHGSVVLDVAAPFVDDDDEDIELGLLSTQLDDEETCIQEIALNLADQRRAYSEDGRDSRAHERFLARQKLVETLDADPCTDLENDFFFLQNAPKQVVRALSCLGIVGIVLFYGYLLLRA
jgi:hypothetical protein